MSVHSLTLLAAVNDMVVPSTVYPSSGGGNGNPECPCDGGTSGYSPGPDCPAGQGGNRGPWNYAQIGAVVGSSMGKIMCARGRRRRLAL